MAQATTADADDDGYEETIEDLREQRSTINLANCA